MSGDPIVRRLVKRGFSCTTDDCDERADLLVYDSSGRWDGSAACADEAHLAEVVVTVASGELAGAEVAAGALADHVRRGVVAAADQGGERDEH